MTLAFWIPRPRLFLKDEKTHWGVSASTRPMWGIAALLEANLEKGARDVSSFHFWGCHLDGRRGLVRTNPGRLWPLAFITARVAMLGLVTHSLLQSLVGSWTSVFMLRRRCLSLFELCFAALRGTPEKHVIRLSPALADELWTWVLISPVCMANLRAPVLDTLYASDASDHLLAAVAAPLPPKVAKEAYRHCLVKGAWSRLLPQAQALLRSRASLPEGLELPDGENFTPHPLWRKLLRSLQFRTCWVARGRPSQHINVKELKAYLTLERDVAERCSSVRLLALLDSQVALAALLKGRSASPALNTLLRRSLPDLIGADLYPGLAFAKSQDNVADDPTRELDPRVPCEALPDWFGPLALGDASLLDEWLSRQADLQTAREAEAFKPEDLERVLPPPACRPGPDLQPDWVFLGRPREPRLLPSAFGHVNGRASRARRARLRRARGLVAPASALRAPPGLLVDSVRGALLELAAFPRHWFLPATGVLDLSAPGFLDLGGGACGMARCLLRLGAPWALAPTGERAPDTDLHSPSLQDSLLRLGSAGCFRAFGVALLGETFSVAWHPPIRSAAVPGGLPHLPKGVFERTVRDNRYSRWAAALRDCLPAGAAFWGYGPDSSFLWRQPEWAAYGRAGCQGVWRVDLCRFGAPWRKRTRIVSSLPFGDARAFCQCRTAHHRLRGRASSKEPPFDRVSSDLPRTLVTEVALMAARSVGWLDSSSSQARKVASAKGIPLNAALAHLSAACGREASNPGPRRPQRAARDFNLESRPLLGPQALGLGAQGWAAFLSWVVCRLSVDPLELFSRSAALLAMALRAYGNWLFCNGGSLHHLRHTLLAAQRKYLNLRPFSKVVWELITRWEHAEPPQHRTPVPEPILKAVVTVGWLLGFRSFAAITLLAYYGLGRIGEVLQCTRQDLLLPSDDLWNQGTSAFLRLGSSKTATRGRPKVQHLKIIDPTAVALVAKVYSPLAKSEPLFSLSAAAYRYRWNAILRRLGLAAELRLTPGGLRGGGAVEAYRKGIAVTEIQWRMRLKHLHTLEFYLQELGAVSALAALDSAASRKVQAAAACYDVLASSADI